MKKIFLPLSLLLVIIASACSSHKDGTFLITDFGARADSLTDNSEAIQRAIDACSAAGGGSVVVPAGMTFMTGPFHLASFVDLHLEPNSRLLANPDKSVYTESAFRENRGEGMMWISGKDIRNVSITGTGTIDGNGVSFMGAELSDSYELKPVTDFDPRPHVLTLVNAEKVNISDVTIRNSAYWTVHLVGCYDVAISNISLLNNLKIRNGDGIDIDHSRKVRIQGCFIESGDDCICLKNRREFEEYGACYDIVVSNCIMTSRSCAVKIGSENMDSISNVLFTNCIITDSNRGIGIQNRDEGTVTDVTFSNMHVSCRLFSDVWWGKSEPIYITSYPRAVGNHKDAGWRFPKGATKGACGEVSRIRFHNIYCTSENGVFVGADTPGKIRDILFDNVSLTLQSPSVPSSVGDSELRSKQEEPGKVTFDLRPRDGEAFIHTFAYGFYLHTADEITLRNCSVKLADFPPSSYAGFLKTIDCRSIQQIPSRP